MGAGETGACECLEVNVGRAGDQLCAVLWDLGVNFLSDHQSNLLPAEVQQLRYNQ